MSDNTTESTGTAGAGTAWSHPLATETEDGARIVYVAVPNEDTLAITQRHWELRIEQEPRVQAINASISLRQFGGDRNVDDVLKDAKKIERYIRTGKVKKGDA